MKILKIVMAVLMVLAIAAIGYGYYVVLEFGREKYPIIIYISGYFPVTLLLGALFYFIRSLYFIKVLLKRVSRQLNSFKFLYYGFNLLFVISVVIVFTGGIISDIRTQLYVSAGLYILLNISLVLTRSYFVTFTTVTLDEKA